MNAWYAFVEGSFSNWLKPEDMLELIKTGHVTEESLRNRGVIDGPLSDSDILADCSLTRFPLRSLLFEANSGVWFRRIGCDSQCVPDMIEQVYQSQTLPARTSLPSTVSVDHVEVISGSKDGPSWRKFLRDHLIESSDPVNSWKPSTLSLLISSVLTKASTFSRLFIQITEANKRHFEFENHVSQEIVREVASGYSNGVITSHLEVLRAGTYVIAGGQVGAPTVRGGDTFLPNSLAVETIHAEAGDRRTVKLRTALSRGYWAVGIFSDVKDVPKTPTETLVLTVSDKTLALGVSCLAGGFLICVMWCLLLVLIPERAIDHPKPPTERERMEAGVRAVLRKYGPAHQTEYEIRQGARKIVDEWESVTKDNRH